MRRHVVVVADPDPLAAQRARQALEEEGWEVRVTDRISEALRTIQGEAVDVLILDTEVAELEWHRAVPIIKEMRPRLPIIITARANAPDLEAEVRRQHVFYYHLKCFGLEELRLAVRSAIQRGTRR